MRLFVKSDAGSKSYIDMEHGDVFEKGADGYPCRKDEGNPCGKMRRVTEMKKHLKITLALLLTAVSSVSFANSCRYCQITMPLRKVDGYYYCNKHYCAKHKMKSYEGKCYRCELESLVSRGKAKCTYCNNIKKLIIAESGGKYKAFCPDHYCAKHKCAFSKSYRDGIICDTCKRANDLLEQAKKAEQRTNELKAESEKIEAEMAQLKKQKEEIRAQMAEPLSGLFGAELNASTESVKAIPVADVKDTYEFTPKKQFRKFKYYAVRASSGRIFEIRAFSNFDTFSDAEAEFYDVVELLDKKYGRIRRGKVQESGLFGRRVIYDFGCNEQIEDPKQGIMVFLSHGDAAEYNLSISAFVVSDMKRIIESNAQKDMDAL